MIIEEEKKLERGENQLLEKKSYLTWIRNAEEHTVIRSIIRKNIVFNFWFHIGFSKRIKETHSHGRVDRETSYEGDPLSDSQKLYFQGDSRSTGIDGDLSNVTWPSVHHRWAPSPPNNRQVTRSPVPLSWRQILWFLALRPVMASNTAIERSLRI